MKIWHLSLIFAAIFIFACSGWIAQYKATQRLQQTLQKQSQQWDYITGAVKRKAFVEAFESAGITKSDPDLPLWGDVEASDRYHQLSQRERMQVFSFWLEDYLHASHVRYASVNTDLQIQNQAVEQARDAAGVFAEDAIKLKQENARLENFISKSTSSATLP